MSLREIHWEVTNVCNLRCKHCLPMSGSARDGELTTTEAMSALERFRMAGVSRINFTGGEPFSRRDFQAILEQTVALGMRAAVITNATLLSESLIETVKRLEVKLGVSLDGADEVTHDAIRGQGSFRRVIAVLGQCRNKGIRTTIYSTVNAANISQIDALAKLAEEYVCQGIHLSEVAISGRAISFSGGLTLSLEQKAGLLGAVARMASSVFGEQMSSEDGSCLVDESALYMSADGELYVCSEVFQRRPDLAIGNVRSIDFRSWLDGKAFGFVRHGYGCCYGMSVSAHVVLIRNVGQDCSFAPRDDGRIETLAQLCVALDGLYKDIDHDCHECQYPDCMGYTWLLEEEVDRLYERGVPLVRVNNTSTFIHSFSSRADGQPDLSARYPPCSQLCTGDRRCSIHEERPFVCHLYPLGLETTTERVVVWALHKDCLHVQRLEERGLLPRFMNRAKRILNSLSPQLLGEIAETYRAVDAISVFPDGENRYFILQEVHCVKMSGSSGW